MRGWAGLPDFKELAADLPLAEDAWHVIAQERGDGVDNCWRVPSDLWSVCWLTTKNLPQGQAERGGFRQMDLAYSLSENAQGSGEFQCFFLLSTNQGLGVGCYAVCEEAQLCIVGIQLTGLN